MAAQPDIPSLSKQERAVIEHLALEGRDTLDRELDDAWLREISKSPTALVYRMRQKGILHNIQRGRYHVNMSGASSERPVLDSLEGLAAAVLERTGRPYYLSWHTALWHHGLIDQQSDTVFVAVEDPGDRASKPQKRPIAGGNFGLRFILLEGSKFFGWDDRTGVPVATIEKALLDSLDHPEYAGPMWAIANAVNAAWKSDRLDVDRLVQDALRFKTCALNRRLGFFLDLYEIPGSAPLLKALGKNWAVPLQPGAVPRRGKSMARRNARWRVYEDPQVISTARSSR